MAGGPAHSVRLLVKPHQLVHQLIDAVAGLRGELLDGRILHVGDIGGELSARRDTDRASRSRAATTFGEGGSIWSMPSSVMTTIVLRAASPASGGFRWWTQWRKRIRHRDGGSRAAGGSRAGSPRP
jgi:hypothetical protein